METRYYLFKHMHFSILRNKDQVIQFLPKATNLLYLQVIFINASVDVSQLHILEDEATVEFSYSAAWEETGNIFGLFRSLFISRVALCAKNGIVC